MATPKAMPFDDSLAMAPNKASTEAMAIETTEMNRVITSPVLIKKPILRAMNSKLRLKE